MLLVCVDFYKCNGNRMSVAVDLQIQFELVGEVVYLRKARPEAARLCTKEVALWCLQVHADTRGFQPKSTPSLLAMLQTGGMLAPCGPHTCILSQTDHTRKPESLSLSSGCLSEGAAPQRLKSSLSLHSPGLPGSCEVNRQDAAVWQHDATKMHEDTVTQTRRARSLRHITKHVNQHRQAQTRLILVQSCPLRGFDLQADVRGNSALGNRRAASSCESKTTQ